MKRYEDDDSDAEDGARRTTRACDACHKSKAKCGGDGVHACPGCVRKGAQCTYSSPKKRGPKTSAVRALQEEIEYLRGQLAAAQQSGVASSSGARSRAAGSEEAAGMDVHVSGVKRGRGSVMDAPPAGVKHPRIAPRGYIAMSDPYAEPQALLTLAPPAAVTARPTIAPLDVEVRFARLYMLYANPVLPMVCRESLYFASLRLGRVDSVIGICKDERVVCDHAAGDCASNLFVPLDASARPARGRRGDGAVELDEIHAGDDEHARLVRLHMAALPAALRTPQANTPALMAAAEAMVYAVLGVGARMDGQPERAEQYIAVSRDALTRCYDQPCLETVSALLLHAYYACGCAVSGDMLRAKCYTSLANEMADGLEMSAAAAKRRYSTNAFSGDRPAAMPSSAGSASSGDGSYRGYPFVETGIPLDILLAVRFLAQLTTAYRALNQDMRGDEWETPRGRVSRVLAQVTGKTRRRVSSKEVIVASAPTLLKALDEAETVRAQHRMAGPMDFSMLVLIQLSRAVIHHAAGDAKQAQEYMERSFACMDNSLRGMTNYFVLSIFVQLIPVCITLGQHHRVQQIMTYFIELTRVWPVGSILIAKAARRVTYCTSHLEPVARAAAIQACGVAPSDAARFTAAASSNAEAAALHNAQPAQWPRVPPQTHTRVPAELQSAAAAPWPAALIPGLDAASAGADALESSRVMQRQASLSSLGALDLPRVASGPLLSTVTESGVPPSQSFGSSDLGSSDAFDMPFEFLDADVLDLWGQGGAFGASAVPSLVPFSHALPIDALDSARAVTFGNAAMRTPGAAAALPLLSTSVPVAATGFPITSAAPFLSTASPFAPAAGSSSLLPMQGQPSPMNAQTLGIPGMQVGFPAPALRAGIGSNVMMGLGSNASSRY